jgi:hypothetical protein
MIYNMKRDLFCAVTASLFAAMSMTSCSNENYEPEAPNTGTPTVSASSNFPADAVITTLTIDTEEAARTRADDLDLPAWDLFESEQSILNGANAVIYVNFAIFHEDGSLYYATSNGVEEGDQIVANKFPYSLTMPLPSGETDFKIFVWAAKVNVLSEKHYVFNWPGKNVYIDRGSSLMPNVLNLDGDAFFYWGTLPNDGSSSSITLKRPFVQVNVLTDELNDDLALSSLYTNGLASAIYFRNPKDRSKIYYPDTYYWDKDEVEMAMIEEKELMQFSYNANYKLFPGATKLNNKITAVTGTVNDRTMAYLGVFYLFAPQTKTSYKLSNGTVVNEMDLNIYDGTPQGDCTQRTTLQTVFPEVKANERIVIYNQSGGGILTTDKSISFSVDSAY